MAGALKYPHLFFDLDHTLWDFETNARDTLAELFVTHTLASRGIPSFEFFFKQYIHHNTVLWKRYTAGHLKQDELRWRRMWRSLLDFNIMDEALARQLSADYLAWLPRRNKLFPHTIEVLEYLKQRGYVLHLITNGFEEVQKSKIQNSGLAPYFKEVITSEKSNSVKPHPAIFEFALKETGADKWSAIMIGDNIETDICGASGAGWDTVFVNHVRHPNPVEATYTVCHLKELENIF
jgi:putative hydrolase of the HAD superfamily